MRGALWNTSKAFATRLHPQVERFGPPKLGFGQPLGLQVDILHHFGPPCWSSGEALGLQLGVWERLGRPSWGPWEALGLQVGVYGKLWAAK